jgi:hypothetical protein
MFSRNMVDIPEIFHWILGIMAQSSWHRKSITISSNLKIDLHLYLPWLRILSLSWRKGKSKLSQRIVDCFLSCSINTFFVVELLWQLNCSGSPTPCVCVCICVWLERTSGIEEKTAQKDIGRAFPILDFVIFVMK